MLPAVLLSCVLSAAPSGPRVYSGFNFGANEVLSLPSPDHVGVYPYATASLMFVLDWFMVAPSFGVEWSPELRRWGLVGNVMVDFTLNDRIGLDGYVRIIHDQTGSDWTHADYLLGGGAGVSFYAGTAIISPSLNVFHALTAPSWNLVPTLNFGLAF
jgi:hypothetical protein